MEKRKTVSKVYVLWAKKCNKYATQATITIA